MNIIEFINDINHQMCKRLTLMQEGRAEDFGLDDRAAYRLWADQDCIIVEKDADRRLQYYGGFEYCDKESRVEIGEYVIYFADDDRVQDHLMTFFEKVEG